MRWHRGLVLALCVVGSSAHPTPEGTADIAQRNPSPIAGPELGWSVDRRDEKIAVGSDISPRDDVGDFRRWTYIGLKTFAVANAGVQPYNIFHDCREFGEDARTDMNCIWASLATLIGFAVLVDHAVAYRGRLADRLHENNWHVPGITKRDEILPLEGELSSLLSLQVRHLGIWDGIDDADDDDEVGFLSKRDNTTEAAPRHVFSSNFHGTDMHFAYMGEINNSSHFRFGYRPGPDPESNRLRSRGNHKYNNQYFKNGGLDFVAVTNPLNDNNQGIYLTMNDKKEFNWLVDQIRCYFSIMDRGLDSRGVNFEVYNAWDKTTLASGAIAPFTNKRKPAIRKMAPKQGAGLIDSCANGGPGKRPSKDTPNVKPKDKPKDELRRVGKTKTKGKKKKKPT